MYGWNLVEKTFYNNILEKHLRNDFFKCYKNVKMYGWNLVGKTFYINIL